jgi:hypothetical protein
MDSREFSKFEKDLSKNHDTADVKAALERETADGSGFEDESELDNYETLPSSDEAVMEKPKDDLEDLK